MEKRGYIRWVKSRWAGGGGEGGFGKQGNRMTEIEKLQGGVETERIA